MATALKVLGLDVASVGQIVPTSADQHWVEQCQDGCYFGLLRGANRLLGVNMIGQTGLMAAAQHAVEKEIPLPPKAADGSDPAPLIEFLQKVDY
jgi:NAD(P)H-nitrite reductase large subunit